MKSKTKWETHPRTASISEKGELVAEPAKLTTEMLKRREFRSNKPFYHDPIYNRQATVDTIRHFAHGIGDANPLFTDEEYAKQSKHGNIIAPGAFLYSVHWTVTGSGAAGLHGWYVGGDWEWYKPIVAGDDFKVVCIIREFVEKKGRMGGGRTWIDYDDIIYINQKGEIAGKEYQHTVRAERGASGSSGKNRSIPKPVYTREDWIKILDTYDKEEVRGRTPRYWEDVKVDDKVGPMIRGPLSVRDEIAWLMGGGSPFFRAHGIQYKYEARHPKALEYVRATGEADVPELVHIFDEFAREIGVERAYDYGNQRMSWLCTLFTNWIGDDGFLWKMSGDLRAFNVMGDITTFKGKVVKKYIDNGKCCVDIEAWAKNQRDEWSITPHISTVILPSKKYGEVVYPEPTPVLYKEIKKARPLNELIAEGLI